MYVAAIQVNLQGLDFKGSMALEVVKASRPTLPIRFSMSKLLFRMRDVPDDEAEEVRSLLVENEIDFFETSAGNWGISLPALWLKNDAQYERARQLLDQYQAERALRIKQEYQLNRDQGEVHTLWQAFKDDPFRFVLYLGLAALVLYLSLHFFVNF